MQHLRIVERGWNTWALVTPTGEDYKTGLQRIDHAVKYAKKEGYTPYRVDKRGEIERYEA